MSTRDVSSITDKSESNDTRDKRTCMKLTVKRNHSVTYGLQNANSDSQISLARVQYSPTTFTAAFTASFVKRLQWKRDTHNKADWRCNSVNCYFVITQQYIVRILNSWVSVVRGNNVLVVYGLNMVHSSFGNFTMIAYKSFDRTCYFFWHYLWKMLEKLSRVVSGLDRCVV